MNKKIVILIALILVVIFTLVIFLTPRNNKEEYNDIGKINEENNEKNIKENKVEDMGTIYIKVNNQVLNIELEDNLATEKLVEKLKNEDITIKVHEYGGFEKVGNLGFSLPREDKNITTIPGDLVLYQGNQISLFYDFNSWNYTKLGKIKDVNSQELKDILGEGDSILTFSLYK